MNSRPETFLLPRIWALFLLVLMGVSARLWFPGNQFPRIPLVSLAHHTPPVVDWLVSCGLIATLVALISVPARLQSLWWMVLAALSVLFVLDQHRLQPWAYQSALYASVFATTCESKARQLIVPLAASIYVFSALGKLDYQFVHTVGIEFLEVATAPIGGLANKLDLPMRAKLAHLFPVTELVAGMLLIPRRTRRLGGIAVIVLHGTLLLILGPWGLDHSYGVLVWNALLAIQSWLLFVQPKSIAPEERESILRIPRLANGKVSSRRLLVRLILLSAIIMPIFERHGYWDHWLSWALYSPHSSRVDVQIHRSAVDLLRPSVRSVMQEETDGGWQDVKMTDWSLAELGVPIYPQARYQLALAVEMAKQAGLTDQIRCKLRGTADRISGERDEKRLLGINEIQRALNNYWFVPRNANADR